jgi:hypothetical protein
MWLPRTWGRTGADVHRSTLLHVNEHVVIDDSCQRAASHNGMIVLVECNN